MLPVLQDRISPVFDVARHFLLVDDNREVGQQRQELSIENTQPVVRAKKIVDTGAQVLICGAITWPLEAILMSAGVDVIPNTCGKVDEVLEAFISGTFDEQDFLMPGCCGRRRHRIRRGKRMRS